MREGLAQSINTAAVRLLRRIGYRRLFDTLGRLGLEDGTPAPGAGSRPGFERRADGRDGGRLCDVRQWRKKG